MKQTSNEHTKTIHTTLDTMNIWPEGWNGYDALPPNHDAIIQARRWIDAFFEETQRAKLSWEPPNTTADAEGSVVFEWWGQHRKITVYIAPDGSIDCLKISGATVDEDIEDGEVDTEEQRMALWRWFVVGATNDQQ